MGVSCLYSDKSTRFRRKGEFVEKEAWVEILFRRITVVKGIFGSPPASQQGDCRRIYFSYLGIKSKIRTLKSSRVLI